MKPWRISGCPTAAGPAAVAVPVGLALLPAEEPPATAGGDVAKLLHVNVQQIAGCGVLVAHDLVLAAARGETAG
jgi:hypothetical protein